MKLEEIKVVVVPNVKPRNPTYRTLANKANAGGAHRDKKAELKKGMQKHKDRMYEEVEGDEE